MGDTVFVPTAVFDPDRNQAENLYYILDVHATEKMGSVILDQPLLLIKCKSNLLAEQSTSETSNLNRDIQCGGISS